jgi:cobalt-zinc-cadmium efflux system membrane fusion protein
VRSRVAFLVGVLVLPLAACGGGSSPDQKAASAPAADKPGYFVVPAAQLAHVEVVPVAKTSWSNTLHTTGTVDWDNDHTVPAITQVSGPITRIAVDAGATVKAGDPLLYVSSPDISNAVSTYRKAKNRLSLAQLSFDRAKDLLEHKVIAQRDFEAAQADFNDAATDVQTALQALKIFGVSQADLDDAEHQNVAIRLDLAMRAPISGTVVQKLVMPGQLIQAGATVTFVISDVSTVWVQGHVYEKDLGAIEVGDKAEIHNPGLPTTYHGVVGYVDRLVDPATRTILVRIVTPNTDRGLKKDLFVDVDLLGRSHRQVLAIPVGAVLYDEQNLPFVYVQVETGKFAQRLIKVGAQQGAQIEVTDGLTTSDRVVAQGSLFLQFANGGGQ